mgnify:CR=1 FL=1
MLCVRNCHNSVQLSISRRINAAISGGRSPIAGRPLQRRMATKLSGTGLPAAGSVPHISVKKSCRSTSDIFSSLITLMSRLLNMLYSAEREQPMAEAKAVYDQCCSSTLRRIIVPMSISAILHLYIVKVYLPGAQFRTESILTKERAEP